MACGRRPRLDALRHRSLRLVLQVAAVSTVNSDGGAANDYCGYDTAVGDLTDDGNNEGDVACPGESGGSVYITQRTTSSYEISRTDTTTAHSFGSSVAVTDVDGDGDADLLVGSTTDETVWLSEGPITASAAYSTIDDESRTITDSGDMLSAVGDVDDDGYDDVVIGRGDSGFAYLASGGAGAVLAGAQTLYAYGQSAAAGDFDDDGVRDLALGYPDYGSQGRAYVLWGPVRPTASPDVTISGTSSEHVGYSLAAGDLDGDGIDDLAIGGYGDDEAASDAGAAWVFLGGGM